MKEIIKQINDQVLNQIHKQINTQTDENIQNDTYWGVYNRLREPRETIIAKLVSYYKVLHNVEDV